MTDMPFVCQHEKHTKKGLTKIVIAFVSSDKITQFKKKNDY